MKLSIRQRIEPTETEVPVWTDARIREAFIYDGGEAEYHDPINGARDQRLFAGRVFDEWLVSHDAAIRVDNVRGRDGACDQCGNPGDEHYCAPIPSCIHRPVDAEATTLTEPIECYLGYASCTRAAARRALLVEREAAAPDDERETLEGVIQDAWTVEEDGFLRSDVEIANAVLRAGFRRTPTPQPDRDTRVTDEQVKAAKEALGHSGAGVTSLRMRAALEASARIAHEPIRDDRGNVTAS